MRQRPSYFQGRTEGKEAAEDDEEEVRVDIAFVDLVYKYVRHSFEQTVALQPPKQHTCSIAYVIRMLGHTYGVAYSV